MKEVPTEELLHFQDYPTTHTTTGATNSTIGIDIMSSSTSHQTTIPHMDYKDPPRDFNTLDVPIPQTEEQQQNIKSFWTLEYYQRFFDVNTKDVTDRILSSMIPRGDNSLKNDIKLRPDLYGPFWISVTLVFTIAISGNIANYLQHGIHHETNYHWKYDFHLVSYAATTILVYISVVPLGVWALIKWSTEIADLDGLEDITVPKPLELVCMYGYSLFIYIPVSILWTIQYAMLQWILVWLAAFLSGSVLLNALMPVLKLSRHKLLIIIGIAICHLLLAAGFMLYFFHVPSESNNILPLVPNEVLIPQINNTKPD